MSSDITYVVSRVQAVINTVISAVQTSMTIFSQFCGLTVTSAVIVASLVTISPAAFAEATFSNPTPSRLEARGGKMNVLESLSPTTLSVTVPPNTVANITVLPPTLISGPTDDPNGTTAIAFLNFGSKSLTSEGNASASLPTGETNLEVGMRVERPVAFAPGNYNYAVNLSVTITPP